MTTPLICFDEDSDARFFRAEAGTMTAATLDAYLKNLGGTKINVLIVGINSQKTNYPSKVMQPWLDEFDIRLGLNQEGLVSKSHPIPSEWSYRRRANIAVLEAQGIDSNAYLLEGAAKRGIAPWIGIRMNDIHDSEFEDSKFHPKHWREHPELRIPGNIISENGYDFSHECVRKMYADLAEEAFLRYHPENVLLDWMRWPAYFPRGTGRERASLITELLKEVRKRIGQPFACRVPLKECCAMDLGLDVRAWVKEGILSHLFIGNFGCGQEFNAPVREWKKITGDVPVIVSLEHGSWETLERRGHKFTIEEARGSALSSWFAGAAGIHPFNCMCMLREEYESFGKQFFNEIHDPELLKTLPRKVYPGWADSEILMGDLDRLCRVPGFYQEWIKTHKVPEGAFPVNEETDWNFNTVTVPANGATVVTDSSGPIWVNGHELSGPFPAKIPAEWMQEGVTKIHTKGYISELYITL